MAPLSGHQGHQFEICALKPRCSANYVLFLIYLHGFQQHPRNCGFLEFRIVTQPAATANNVLFKQAGQLKQELLFEEKCFLKGEKTYLKVKNVIFTFHSCIRQRAFPWVTRGFIMGFILPQCMSFIYLLNRRAYKTIQIMVASNGKQGHTLP
jgi:hypothetical protein